MVGLAQPPGVRATRTGGEWKFIRGPAPRSCNYFIEEYEQFLLQCSEAERFLIKDEIASLMRSAEAGRCTFGRGRGYDVDFMTCTTLVLELRLMTVPKRSAWGPVHLRIYFTEPEHDPGSFYIAKFAWKIGGALGLKEQTKHATEAERRIKNFFA
jgi:hypothetical protein